MELTEEHGFGCGKRALLDQLLSEYLEARSHYSLEASAFHFEQLILSDHC